MANLHVLEGDPGKLGVTKKHGGYNFAISVPEGASAELLLYRENAEEAAQIVPLPEEERTGQVSAVFVEIPADENWEYTYRIRGIELPDPYARQIWCRTEKGKTQKRIRCGLAPVAAAHTRPLELPYEDCVFYKTHVRGFTRQKNSKVRHKGTFLGVQEKIPYLKELGITSLLLMPVYEFDRFPRKKAGVSCQAETGQLWEGTLQGNYWGYTEGLYFVPRSAYCATQDPAKEFAELVDALHEAEIECILEFYFPENTLPQLVLDVLRYWRLNFQVDGFHLPGQGDWVKLTALDPLLKRSKRIYSAAAPELLAAGKADGRYRQIGEMNPGYEQMMRRFLKGDEGCLEGAAWYLRRSEASYESINYFADQNGFTMADMVSYERKHNEENRENGRDGSNCNYSWNCGVEGPTRKLSVRKRRMQQLYNAFFMLFTSRGTPMLYGGDEFCNSQQGNNNAWCQDNETGWLDWKNRKESGQLRSVVRQMIAFRKEHPVLHQRKLMERQDYKMCGWPELSYHGRNAWVFPSSDGRSLGMMLCGTGAGGGRKKTDDFLYIAYNMYWEKYALAIPDLPKGRQWVIKADTSRPEVFYAEGGEKVPESTEDKKILVPPRTVMILIGK